MADLGAPLVTLEEAAAHLHLVLDGLAADVEADLDAKRQEASDTIRDYLKERNDVAWTDLDAPRFVKAAVKLYLGTLWEHRGDDAAPDNFDEENWKAIAALLMRARDPALR